MNTDICPHCGANLKDAEIPDRPGEHYSRRIGVEVSYAYDGILFWQCPDCGGQWHRFTQEHFLRARAERYMTRPAKEGGHEDHEFANAGTT